MRSTISHARHRALPAASLALGTGGGSVRAQRRSRADRLDTARILTF